MKSILIGLLLVSWTASSQPSTGDSVYCLSISKARLLVADALKLRVSEDQNATLMERVRLLEEHELASYKSFTNLLKIEQDKLSLQKEITLHTESISNTYQEEKDSLKKQVRRLKWQRAGLGVLTVLTVTLSL